MKASELIQKLNKCVSNAGDVDVIISIHKSIGSIYDGGEIIITMYEDKFSVDNTRYLDISSNKIYLGVKEND